VDVSWTTAKRWKVAVDRGGLEALAAKPHPGKQCRLAGDQKQELVRILLQGPLKAGFFTDLWTCPRVAQVIQREFGVSYHPDHVWKVLHALGWTCQKPEQRSRKRDEAAIERWRKKVWPRLRKKAKRGALWC
jgi:transposase